jgi:predicted DCC family thiol-disulfide oxidoreductase YuxK
MPARYRSQGAQTGASQPTSAVFIIDSTCGLCQRVAGYIKVRARGSISIGQGASDPRIPYQQWNGLLTRDSAERLLQHTSILVSGGQVRTRSQGVLEALAQCGFGWRILSLVMRPRPTAYLADRIYAAVARNRHKLHGSTCSIPPARTQGKRAHGSS